MRERNIHILHIYTKSNYDSRIGKDERELDNILKSLR